MVTSTLPGTLKNSGDDKPPRIEPDDLFIFARRSALEHPHRLPLDSVDQVDIRVWLPWLRRPTNRVITVRRSDNCGPAAPQKTVLLQSAPMRALFREGLG